jgi:precorrin-6B methylase 2
MRSPIDDVRHVPDSLTLGPPILFLNPEIRRMMRLARVGPEDVFCDLGSGWGQHLIVAATEFKVRQAVGIEVNKRRLERSKMRLETWTSVRPDLKGRVRVVKADFMDSDDTVTNEVLKEATVVFIGLWFDAKQVIGLLKRLRNGCRLLFYYNCLIPEIIPDAADFPFYVARKPFLAPKSELEWLRSVLLKPSSSLHEGEPDADELWDELTHDSKLFAENIVTDYRKRLKAVLSTA